MVDSLLVCLDSRLFDLDSTMLSFTPNSTSEIFFRTRLTFNSYSGVIYRHLTTLSTQFYGYMVLDTWLSCK